MRVSLESLPMRSSPAPELCTVGIRSFRCGIPSWWTFARRWVCRDIRHKSSRHCRGVDLDHGLLFNVPDLPVILLTESAGAIDMERSLAARPWIRVGGHAQSGDLAQALASLRSDGIRRISCVGGRSLAADLLSLKMVDDLYLTTSARRGGVPGTPLPAEAFNGDVVLEKRGTGEDLGVVFQHFDLRKDRRRVVRSAGA